MHNVRNAESVVQPLQFVNPGISDEDIHAVMRVLRSGWLTTGFECRAFEQELSTTSAATTPSRRRRAPPRSKSRSGASIFPVVHELRSPRGPSSRR